MRDRDKKKDLEPKTHTICKTDAYGNPTALPSDVVKADVVHKPSATTGAYNFGDYRGTKAVAASGAPCLTWDRTELASDLGSFAAHGISGKHFFCRKPPSKSSLGCYTSSSTWESCTVDASQDGATGLVASFDASGSKHVFRVNVKSAGVYDIHVTVNGQAIGQDLLLHVGPSSATVQNAVVISRGEEQAIAGTESAITVFAVDAHGNVLQAGASAMEASILPSMRNATSGTVIEGVSVVNQQDGSYRVAYSPKLLHSTFDQVKRKFVYDLRLSMASSGIRVVSDLIYVASGAADAARSSVDAASIPQSMVAASSFAFDVNIRDEYGNAIDDTRAHAIMCNGAAAQHIARVTPGPFVPRMRLVAEQATGSYSHACTLDGTQFDTVRYEVTEAAFSGKDSFMDAVQSSVVAGSTLGLGVSLRDIFGNAYSSAVVGSVSFNVTRMASGSSTSSIASPANVGRDRFVGTARMTVAGQYRVSVHMVGAGSTLIDSAIISVVPAAAAAATSVASGAGLTAGAAGEESSFAITAKDEYGNLRTGSTKDPYTCTVLTPQNNASVACAIAYDSVAQSYIGKYTPTTAGTYVLSVAIYGEAVSLQSSPQLVVVMPATADATKSVVEGPGLSGGVAGSSQHVIVHAIDTHGNSVPGNGVSFVLEISGPQSSADRRSVVVSCTFQSDNLHRCDFTVTQVGTYDLAVKLDQAVVAQASPAFTASTFDASRCEIRGLSSGAIALEAGSSFTFMVDVRDTFGNLRTGDADHVVATSTSAKHANVISVYNYGNGTHAVTLSSTIADTYVTSVELYGVELPGSPISTVVAHAEASATKSRVYGSGVEAAVAGATATFYVQLQDRFGNLATSSTSADIAVSFTGPGTPSDVSLSASSTTAGVFVYTYKMRVSGQYSPTVNVKGSPVSLAGSLDVVPAAVSATTSFVTTATPIGGGSFW